MPAITLISPMLRLLTLGGMGMTKDGATLSWIQRGWQRGALFALLAAAGKRGVDRETLAALLWPDSPDALARHSLDELLSRARRETGERDVFTTGALVALNPSCVAVDLVEFDEAIATGHLERAVALYAGPFADGLRLSAAEEVERRLVAMRGRRAGECSRALETLAERATARDAHADAATWWQRAVTADPFSARATKGYLTSLLAIGESARAIAHLRIYRTMLRDTLEIEADEDIVRLEARLRAGPTGDTATSPASTPRSSPAPGLPLQNILTDGTVDESAVAERVRQLQRLLGDGYTLGPLIESGSLASAYRVTSRERATPAELHVFGTPLDGPEAVSRFTSMFGRVRVLSHHGIAPVFDCGVRSGLGYCVVASRPGPSLRDVLRRQRSLSLPEALEIGRGIADALRFAHEHGVVHGDVRPKRIWMSGRTPVVSGFGVVEALSGDPLQRRSTIVALGSPVYQSPEQLLDGAGADVASDVYAFGSVVYELLTGEPPFGARAGVSVVRRKMSEDPVPVRELRPSVPHEIEQLVMRCLARVPGDRDSRVPAIPITAS